ncbi:MAG: DNA-directed RNA polymerase subunit omega [Actinomycetota bacterium]|nr:DNA-directed RNA polymerase subunit omega [Actinomycetota bacterium]
MAEESNLSMMKPPIEDLLAVVDSKFTLVTISARRARQINAYFSRLGDGIGSIVPPQVDSISKKSLTVAFEEIAAGKITYSRPVPEQEEPSPEAEAQSSEDALQEASDAGTED